MSDLQIVGSSGSARRKKSVKAEINPEQPKDWTIKGVPAETVEVTREAAKQNGMKINAWVGKALRDAAQGAKTDAMASTTIVRDTPRDDVLEEIVRLRRQNDELVQTVNSMTAILAKMYAEKS